MTFQRLFAQWLHSKGLTHGTAAPLLGVCERTVLLYATGRTLPPNVRIPLLAERMGLDGRKVLDAVLADRARRVRKSLAPAEVAP